MSLFSEAKAWELGSLLSSATEKVGVWGTEAGGGGGDFSTMGTHSSTKRPRNSLSRYFRVVFFILVVRSFMAGGFR